MSVLSETPQSERLHIGIFGKRNAGKSSLLNALTAQSAALVSDVKGTTTDPVYKAMELLPLGPVVFIDTAGIDDDSELGALRIEKTKSILHKTDLALLVVEKQIVEEDQLLINLFVQLNIKHLIVYNKCDLQKFDNKSDSTSYATNSDNEINVSCKTGHNIQELKEKIAALGNTIENSERLVGDLISANDIVVLVVPIDKAAPKGRLILPQQQAVRDILDAGATALVTRDSEYAVTLNKLQNSNLKPSLVITDSQVFALVAKATPEHIRLTSFSILMARYKGALATAVAGAKAIDGIKSGDKILIAEACTHHRQCDDIATVKLPRLIEKYTGVKPIYEFASGGTFPKDLSSYKLIIHCGGCMINKREMTHRISIACEANIPITNYGVIMSYMQGILPRCISCFSCNSFMGKT
jgi:[FeFe] hydrogenase H-cluster maturation GTPase HydF